MANLESNQVYIKTEVYQCEICGAEHPSHKMNLFPIEDGEETRVEVICRKCIAVDDES